MVRPPHDISWLLPAVRSEEGGWTLIELIVALTLLTVLGAVGVGILTGLLGSAGQTTSNRKAQAAVISAMDVMGGDIRSSVAKGRDENRVRDVNNFRKFVLLQKNLWDQEYGTNLDLRDISFAGPTRLIIETDAIPEASSTRPQVECVDLFVQVTGAKWTIRRNVHRYVTDCPANANALGAPIKSTELLPPAAISTAPTAANPLFSYTLQYNTDYAKLTSSPNLDTAKCKRFTNIVPNAGGNAAGRPAAWRNWITGVTINLQSVVLRKEAGGADSARQSFTVRSRQSYDYQYGLGCAR